MEYALFGKVFISTIVTVVVWVITVALMSRGDWGDGMAYFFFVGPLLGIGAAVLTWLYILPPL